MDNSNRELAAGTILCARYKVERILGRGGMGAVYAVRQINTGEALALKVLSPALVSNAQAVERFRTEARAPVRIGTDHVVRIIDADISRELGEVPILVMELLEGRDLDTELGRRGAIPAAEVVLYLRQVARALDKAHSIGITHRDLKPANIYLTERDDGTPLVKILDFGIAELTEDGTIIGTPMYMSPEQARGQASKIGPSADLWALGLIAFRLLTGKSYWSAESIAALIGQIVYDPMPPPSQLAPHLGPRFDEWFARACNREVDRRFPNAAELVARLADAMGVSMSPQMTGQLDASQFPGAAYPALSRGYNLFHSPKAPAEEGSWMASPQPTAQPKVIAELMASMSLMDDDEDVPTTAAMREQLESMPRSAMHDSPPLSAATPSAPPAPYLDENVQFTVYRPKVVQPERWYPLLAFAHLSERRPDASPDEPDPVEEMLRQAQQALGAKARAYADITQDSRHAVPAEGELTFLPEMTGVVFNPPQRSFLWQEAVHKEEFRLRASGELDGTTVRGRLSVFLGSILLAEVSLSLRVDSRHAATPESTPPEATQARIYRKIFASYSHKDLAVVRQFEQYGRALGDEYLRDWIHLRTGEVWNDRLRQLIEQADVFQLFWSNNSMRSPFVRQEWEHALALARPNFVRPTYWERPMPELPEQGLPPEGLRRLHFQHLGGEHKGDVPRYCADLFAQAEPSLVDPSPRILRGMRVVVVGLILLFIAVITVIRLRSLW